MSAEAAVAAGRAAAEALMTDRCTITRPGAGPAQLNEGTGALEPPARIVAYTGKCRVQVPNVAEQEALAGDRTLTVQQVLLQLPVLGSEDVQPGDRVRIDSATLDPSLVGLTLTVRGTHRKTHATARRLRCEEVA